MFEGREERKGRVSPEKAAFARPAKDGGLAREAGTELRRAVELIAPDTLIGAAAKGGAFDEGVVRALTKVNRAISPLRMQRTYAVRIRSMAAVRAAPCKNLYSYWLPPSQGTIPP